jgi:hypothetical protein
MKKIDHFFIDSGGWFINVQSRITTKHYYGSEAAPIPAARQASIRLALQLATEECNKISA